jgi:hypothetical protein
MHRSWPLIALLAGCPAATSSPPPPAHPAPTAPAPKPAPAGGALGMQVGPLRWK